jgi:leader peptidase (prepilin peptidase)/N-methyltransferase
MGLLGAFTGWAGALEGFFVACLVGSVVGIFVLLRYRSRYLPFGPFLAVGCFGILLWPGAFEAGLRWYLGLFA